MSDKLNLIGKSRDEIARAVARKRPEELVDIITELATIEPHFSPKTIARARQMSQRRIVEMCRTGEMPGAHKPLANGWRVALSGIRQWDESTAVTLANGGPAK
jgi:acetolactate synthase small subunit